MRKCREFFVCWVMTDGLSVSSIIKVAEFVKNPTWAMALSIMGFPEIDIGLLMAFITIIPAMKRYRRFIECLERTKEIYDYLLWAMELVAFAENIGLLTTIFPIVCHIIPFIQGCIHPPKPDSYLTRIVQILPKVLECYEKMKQLTAIRHLVAATILAGFIAIIGGAAFAGNHWMALHLAAGEGDTAEVKRLIGGGANVNAKGINGLTPLHFAATESRTETAQFLINAGANIEAKNNNGATPLHIAAVFSQPKATEFLIKAGANTESKEENGKTPLHVAINEIKTDWLGNPLRGDLRIAAERSQTETILVLINAGVDVFARTDSGHTPLDIAIQAHGKDSKIALALQKAMKEQTNK